MMVTSSGSNEREVEPMYNRDCEVKAFDESKAGVEGLVDGGMTTRIPRMFIHKHTKLDNKSGSIDSTSLNIPIIDFKGIDSDANAGTEIIAKVCSACQEWGFFQLINHGIPGCLLEQVIDGVRRFHEEDVQVKKEYYSRDYTRKVIYNTNFDLYQSKAACWRDTLTLVMAPHPPSPGEMPQACRDAMIHYTNEVMKLGEMLYELLSEALGLNPNHLKSMGSADGLYVAYHYYPACPEPELTMGNASHTDSGFITLLLQDQIGGLQVFQDNQWVEVNPVPGGLVFNVGDLLKLISNGKFVSSYHRVVAKNAGPRISVACIFRTHFEPENSSRLYGPIQELLSEEFPPLYRTITVKEMISQKHSTRQGISPLEQFKL